MRIASDTNLKESLVKLAGLSDVESKVYSLKRQLEEIPAQLQAMEDRLAQLQISFEEKKKLSEENEKNSRRIENELNDSREQIKKKEARLYEIKTTKEYQATLKEIATAKKQNIDRETELLRLMENLEGLKKELGPLEEEMGTLQNKVSEEKGRISGEIEALQKELEEQEKIKANIFTALDAGIVSRYEKILIRRQPALAPVRSGTCQECHMNVPPQLYIEIQRCREIISCPSCSRILFIPNE